MNRRTPLWIAAIIVSIALIEPVTHRALTYALPDKVAGTGLHIPDDAFLMPSLKIFRNDFYSPYLSCRHPEGSHDWKIYSLPHYWIYGIVGHLGYWLGLGDFMALGLANGLFGALYLWAAYRFLLQAIPALANRAFVLFALGGGLGGALYLITGLLGVHDHPQFDFWFHRYARYELLEGPFFSPILLQYRLYYAAALALGFCTLTGFLRAVERNARSHIWPILGLFLTTYCHVRIGPLFWLALVCLLIERRRGILPRLKRLEVSSTIGGLRLALLYTMPVALAAMLVAMQFRLHPASVENIGQLLRRSMGFGSFLSAACLMLLAAAPAALRSLGQLRGTARGIAWAAAGYLAAFAVLYAGHQAYYGNWLGGGDAAAAIAISDWALIGALAGMAACRRGILPWLERPEAASTASAFLLWFLVLAAIAVSAWGQGWFLRFMPERCMVLMGLPLAALAAKGIEEWRIARPRLGRLLWGMILVCGLCSAVVSVSVFQGPLSHGPGQGTFQWAHAESITPAESEVIGSIERGVVLAPASEPPLYTDIAVNLREGATTMLGQATLSLGDTNVLEMNAAIQRWFAPKCSEAERKAFADQWCVDYVLCPEVRPVEPVTLDQLRRTPWLHEVARLGGACLFLVERGETPQ